MKIDPAVLAQMLQRVPTDIGNYAGRMTGQMPAQPVGMNGAPMAMPARPAPPPGTVPGAPPPQAGGFQMPQWRGHMPQFQGRMPQMPGFVRQFMPPQGGVP